MPMPNITAKNISARIWPLSEAAATTLLGTIDSSMSIPRGWLSTLATISRLRSTFCASSCWARAGSTPVPGRSTFTSTRPRPTATPDSTTV